MINFIKSIFRKPRLQRPEQSNEDRERIIKEQNDFYKEERQKRKANWERQNELARQHDACFLNTVKTSFDGTFEEYEIYLMQKYQANSLANLYQQSLVNIQRAHAQQSNPLGYYNNYGLGSTWI